MAFRETFLSATIARINKREQTITSTELLKRVIKAASSRFRPTLSDIRDACLKLQSRGYMTLSSADDGMAIEFGDAAALSQGEFICQFVP